MQEVKTKVVDQVAKETENPVARRDYKDTLFRLIFKEKGNLLSLYNAVNGTDYTDEDAFEIVTLENAVFMNMKNDLAFIMDFQLYLYEHQSTFCPNMPLRNLFYIAKELQKLVDTDRLYQSTYVKIPTPRFLVFYNGTREQPERQTLYLSDAFERPVEDVELELKVQMLNINSGKNQQLKEQCRTLKEYMQFVDRVRKYAQTMELTQAVVRAVDECIREDILREFLTKHRAEAIAVSIFEYNEEKALKYIREDEFAQGVLQGEEKKLIQMICKKLLKGKTPDVIAEELEEEQDIVDRICKVAERYAPDYDVEAILKELQ